MSELQQKLKISQDRIVKLIEDTVDFLKSLKEQYIRSSLKCIKKFTQSQKEPT